MDIKSSRLFLAVLCLASLILSGCARHDEPVTELPDLEEQEAHPEESPDPQDDLRAGTELPDEPSLIDPWSDEELDHFRLDKNPNPFELSREPSGEWLKYDGMKICDGYAVPTDSQCTATIPDDWKAFEYNGQTYHYVPLAGASFK